MKYLLFTLIIFFSLETVHSSPFFYKKEYHNSTITCKLKVIVKENEEPIDGVLIKVNQGERLLGEVYTDNNGEGIILCRYLTEENKKVDIAASKKGYHTLHIKGELITNITSFKFSMNKLNSSSTTQSTDLNFNFQREKINSSLN